MGTKPRFTIEDVVISEDVVTSGAFRLEYDSNGKMYLVIENVFKDDGKDDGMSDELDEFLNSFVVEKG